MSAKAEEKTSRTPLTYLNTYDLVDVDENGNIRVIGRMNKFFVNNEGVRFDAGLIETAVSGEPGIVDCGIVPAYNKLIHDTTPILYVKTTKDGPEAVRIVKNALFSVFVQDGKIIDSNLPSKVVITDELPYTHTGKVDVHEIQRGKYDGHTLRVDPVRKNGRLVDIALSEIDKLFPFNSAGMINPDMLIELIKKGVIEPEMIGRLLAKILLNQDETQKKRKKKRRKRDFYRGC